MLSFENVNFLYEGEKRPTLQDLSFNVEKGGFVSIIGVSGCGKSTIFKLINKLLPIQSGKVLVNGQSVLEQKDYCGYMPQRDLLMPWRTVEKNMALPMEIQKKPENIIKTEAERVLKQAGLYEVRGKYPHELSGGMRQRVAFGRTLITGCDLLLLDEPFSALDFLTRLSMQEWLLAQWQQQNKTVLFITHDVEEALFLSSKILVVTETPINKLEEIEVPLLFPRDRAQLAKPEIIKIKEHLIELLQRQVSI